jgi:hypothetical protein
MTTFQPAVLDDQLPCLRSAVLRLSSNADGLVPSLVPVPSYRPGHLHSRRCRLQGAESLHSPDVCVLSSKSPDRQLAAVARRVCRPPHRVASVLRGVGCVAPMLSFSSPANCVYLVLGAASHLQVSLSRVAEEADVVGNELAEIASTTEV